MMPDTPYILYRAGRWEEALALLPEQEAARRAEILVDRFWWRHVGEPEATAAVASVTDEVTAAYLAAQLAYTRMLFDLDPRPDDAEVALYGFEAAGEGWGRFWLGVYTENVAGDPGTAAAHYAAVPYDDDPLLESYVTRHLGFQLLGSDSDTAIALLRRSHLLRAALGARPQTAAAAAALADVIPAGREADDLRATALLTAEDLSLTWLLTALRSD